LVGSSLRKHQQALQVRALETVLEHRAIMLLVHVASGMQTTRSPWRSSRELRAIP
jgi:hypothetical protein